MTNHLFRTPSLKILAPIVQCWCLLWPEVTRRQFLLLLVIKNIIPFTVHLVFSPILHVRGTIMLYFLWPSFLFQKVSRCLNPSYHLLLKFKLHLASKHQSKNPAFQRFVCQMYHMCLARVFAPLKAAMTEPEVVLCPDGHFQHAVYSLGPYIADYPKQVWLTGIVQCWCLK